MAEMINQLYDLLSDEKEYQNLLQQPHKSFKAFSDRISFAIAFMDMLQEHIDTQEMQPAPFNPIHIQIPSPLDYRMESPSSVSTPTNNSSSTSSIIKTPLKRVTPTSAVTANKSDKRRILPVQASQISPDDTSAISFKRMSPVSAPLTSAECLFNTAQLKRIGHLFAYLILEKYYAISQGLPLLLQLLDIPRMLPLISTKQSKLFSQLSDLHTFLTAAIDSLAPILFAFGKPFMRVFTELDFIKLHCAELVDKHRRDASDVEDLDLELTLLELRNNATSDKDNAAQHFLRPFIEDVDSRLEYKNGVDSAAYNERERCYDMFSNVFRRFQEVLVAQPERLSEFWSELTTESSRILDIMLCSMDWFVGVFVDMLLFYCPDDRVQTPPVAPTASAIAAATHVQNPWAVSFNYKDIAADTRHRKLEERIGPGGRGSFPQQRPHPNQPRARTSGATKDKFERPAAEFPGTQQFFFRFILMTNNNQFMRRLELALISEIMRLSEELRAAEAVIEAADFCKGLMKLKLLGRFYGLTVFSSQWTLPLIDRGGTVSSQLRQFSSRKNQFLAQTLPFETALREAFSAGHLCVSVPWICESLKCLQWDVNWSDVSAYTTLLSQLAFIQHSSHFIAHSQRLSMNRVFVLTEIQTQLLVYPLKELVAVDWSDAEVSISSLDDKALLAEDSSLCTLMPFLGDALTRAQSLLHSKTEESKKVLQKRPSQTPLKMSVLLRDTSSPASLNRSASFQSAITSSPNTGTKSNKDIKTKLFMSPSLGSKPKAVELSENRAVQLFWQQHAQHYKMSTFVLDYFQHACVSQLRDRVAQAVRELWSRSFALKESAVTAANAGVFKMNLERELDEVFKVAGSDGKAIVESFFLNALDNILNEFCKLYPSDERVNSLAMHLIKTQGSSLIKSLIDFMHKFARRKLEEVLSLSVQQFSKQITEESSYHEDTDRMVPQPPRDNDNLVAALVRCKPWLEFTAGGKGDYATAALHLLSNQSCEPVVHLTPPEYHGLNLSIMDVAFEIRTVTAELILSLQTFLRHAQLEVTATMVLSKNILDGSQQLLTRLKRLVQAESREVQGRFTIEVTKLIAIVITPLLTMGSLLGDTALPCDWLVAAYQQGMLTLNGIARVIVPVIKPTYILYQASCKNLDLAQSQLPGVCNLIRRILSTEKDTKPFVDSHSVEQAFPDSTLLAAHKKLFSNDMLLLLVQLSKSRK